MPIREQPTIPEHAIANAKVEKAMAEKAAADAAAKGKSGGK